jgi:hypothetical protein
VLGATQLLGGKMLRPGVPLKVTPAVFYDAPTQGMEAPVYAGAAVGAAAAAAGAAAAAAGAAARAAAGAVNGAATGAMGDVGACGLGGGLECGGVCGGVSGGQAAGSQAAGARVLGMDVSACAAGLGSGGAFGSDLDALGLGDESLRIVVVTGLCNANEVPARHHCAPPHVPALLLTPYPLSATLSIRPSRPRPFPSLVVTRPCNASEVSPRGIIARVPPSPSQPDPLSPPVCPVSLSSDRRLEVLPSPPLP